MAENDPRKAERLVSFRKLQRERASMEAAAARNEVERAEAQVEKQKETIAEESAALGSCPGDAVRPEDFTLALACIEAARADLQQKQTTLQTAEKTLGQKSDLLLAAHTKVRQMEALASQIKATRKVALKRKEAKEIDDLAVNREARKP